MIKKIWLLISCLSMITLVACGHANPEELNVASETTAESANSVENDSEFSLSLVVADAELENYYEVDFSALSGGFVTEGVSVMFNFNQRVYDFELFEMLDGVLLEETDAIITGTSVLVTIPNLSPDVPLVLTNYPTLGHEVGFSFTTADGERQDFNFRIEIFSGELTWQPFLRYEIDPDLDLSDIEVEGVMPEFEPIETVLITRMELETATEPFDFTQYFERYNLDFIQLFDYDNMMLSRLFGIDAESPVRDSLLIRTTGTITDVDFIIVHLVFSESSDFNFTIAETQSISKGLLPNEGIVISNFFTNGTIPESGITFVDELGVRRHYLIFQDQSDEFPPYRLIPFVPHQN